MCTYSCSNANLLIDYSDNVSGGRRCWISQLEFYLRATFTFPGKFNSQKLNSWKCCCRINPLIKISLCSFEIGNFDLQKMLITGSNNYDERYFFNFNKSSCIPFEITKNMFLSYEHCLNIKCSHFYSPKMKKVVIWVLITTIRFK